MENKIIFRASQVGSLMQADNARVDFTETQIDAMIEIFNSSVHGRYEEIKSKFLHKGNEREQDSITLLSRVTKTFYKKNSTRLTSGLLTGEPDLFKGSIIEEAEEIFDCKTSWSKNTFDKARVRPLNKNYYWQGQAYMYLTGAKKHTLAYCLVNSSMNTILSEIKKLQYDLVEGCEEYILKAKQIERNHIFNLQEFLEEFPSYYHLMASSESLWIYDIPIEKRLHLIPFNRNQQDIDKMLKRLEICKIWIEKNLL